jgi:presenilin-like A22 family membrane protease
MSRGRWLGLPAMYLAGQFLGLLLADPFRSEGLASGSNPQSPTGPLLLILVVVLAPLVILLFARRKGGVGSLRHLILLGIAGSLYITLYATFSLVPPGAVLLMPYSAEIVLDPALAAAGLVSASLYLALLIEPQWYVVDLAGLAAGGALIAILGISFAPLAAMILLGALMVYDAIAVYRTKHMVSLADVVTEMKLPILMVMPEGPGFDYPRAPPLREQRAAPVGERAAMFMGLGDIVIPGTLIVSAFVWLPATPSFGPVGANLLVALGALVGSLVGYAVLMRRVATGEPQAGLPFLNGGAIVGYALAYLVLFRSFTLGLTGGL